MSTNNYPLAQATCTCGKLVFLSRKDARKALRRTYPGNGMQVYHCPEWNGWDTHHWHYGHPEQRGRGYEREIRALQDRRPAR